jgi:hypothetical protein
MVPRAKRFEKEGLRVFSSPEDIQVSADPLS